MSISTIQFEFGELTPAIVDYASKENSSKLLDCRLVSTSWRWYCEALLKELWNELQKNPPEGRVDILLKMEAINRTTPPTPFMIMKFRGLECVFKRAFFNERGYNTNLPVSFPIRINDFQILQFKLMKPLELHNNQLAEIPDFNQLPNLTRFYLNNAQLLEVPDFDQPNLTPPNLNNNQ